MSSETKICRNCSKQFLVLDKERDFLRKKELPLPVDCPKCRQDHRLSYRNERNLYRRTCDQCHDSMISPYSAESPYVVYCQKCFWEYVG